jgi:hypothetical protein
MSIDPLDSQAPFAVPGCGPSDVERLFREHNSALLRFVTAAPNTSAANLATDGRLSGVGTYAPPRTFGVWATAKF